MGTWGSSCPPRESTRAESTPQYRQDEQDDRSDQDSGMGAGDHPRPHSNFLRSVGGVVRMVGVPGGGEGHQLGQLLVEALPTDPVLDGALPPEVSGGTLHLSIAPCAEVHLTGVVDFAPGWCHPRLETLPPMVQL